MTPPPSAQPSTVQAGQMIVATFPQRQPSGREQVGQRPAVILGVPGRTGPGRFPMVLVAPLTTATGQAWAAANPALYPLLPSGTAGLPRDSVVLLDQLTALDASRLTRLMGGVTPEQLHFMQAALRDMFDL